MSNILEGGVVLFTVLVLLYCFSSIGSPFQSGDPFTAGNATSSGTLS